MRVERWMKPNLNFNFSFFTCLVANAAVSPSLNEISRASLACEFEVGCKGRLFGKCKVGARF
jgi:hypothetical protein